MRFIYNELHVLMYLTTFMLRLRYIAISCFELSYLLSTLGNVRDKACIVCQ